MEDNKRYKKRKLRPKAIERKIGVNAAAKGAEGEREAARVLEGQRKKVRGVPSEDVVDRDGRFWEVKRRHDSFKVLYDYLNQTEGVDRVILRDDRKPWLVVMNIDTWKEDVGWNEQV